MKGRSGFTLIELLVVIAIIAILAAILFPVFAKAREKARAASCLSNIKQLNMSIQMYVGDYNEMFPKGGWQNDGGTSDWQNSVATYVRNEPVYWCPSARDIHDVANPCWKDWNRTAVDYLFNNNLYQGRGVNQSEVVAPADCILLIEGHSDWGGGACRDWKGNNCNSVWCTEYTTFGDDPDLVTGDLSWAFREWGLPRHMDGGNVSFVDGHAKWYRFGWCSVMLEQVLPRNRYLAPAQDGGTAWGNGNRDGNCMANHPSG